MVPSSKALRILVIVNLPWDARLGASRVWMELAGQWRDHGHVVEKFSLSDVFPGVRASRVTFALRQLIFIRKAAAFVRQHAQRFDVIDALIGTLPFSKDELGFPGVIVARSVGLYHFYDRFEQSVERRWPRPEQG
nr:glycosyltransferase family 1 protein [Chthoniobacterales bacterium]